MHIFDESGQLVAQSDSEPAGWSQPTTGWVVGWLGNLCPISIRSRCLHNCFLGNTRCMREYRTQTLENGMPQSILEPIKGLDADLLGRQVLARAILHKFAARLRVVV